MLYLIHHCTVTHNTQTKAMSSCFSIAHSGHWNLDFLEYFDLMLHVHMAVSLNELFFPKSDILRVKVCGEVTRGLLQSFRITPGA